MAVTVLSNYIIHAHKSIEKPLNLPIKL